MNMPTPQRRWWIWLPLLAVSAWLALFGDKTPSGESPVTQPRATAGFPTDSKTSKPESNTAASANPRSRTPVALTLEPLIPRQQLYPQSSSKTNTKDLFASSSWTQPPKPAAPSQALPPPLPTAPPLPFTFIGKKLEAGTWEVYVARGEQSFVLRQGSVIDNTYRVHAVTPPSLSLIYLPLGQTQTLAIGESQ